MRCLPSLLRCLSTLWLSQGDGKSPPPSRVSPRLSRLWLCARPRASVGVARVSRRPGVAVARGRGARARASRGPVHGRATCTWVLAGLVRAGAPGVLLVAGCTPRWDESVAKAQRRPWWHMRRHRKEHAPALLEASCASFARPLHFTRVIQIRLDPVKHWSLDVSRVLLLEHTLHNDRILAHRW